MKFFNFFIVVLIVVFSCSLTADADGLSYREKKEIEEKSEYGYKGSSGTRYKYDLSKPVDKIRYKSDVGSQIRDKIYMPIKPGVKIDRSLNQYGGGVEN